MSSYVFPGFPAFLESAAAELNHPESAGPARRFVPLTTLANLCAQAAHGDPSHAEGILVKAAEIRDQLATALRAAELMLIDVENGRRCPITSDSKVSIDADPPIFPTVPTVTLAARKGSRSTREPS